MIFNRYVKLPEKIPAKNSCVNKNSSYNWFHVGPRVDPVMNAWHQFSMRPAAGFGDVSSTPHLYNILLTSRSFIDRDAAQVAKVGESRWSPEKSPDVSCALAAFPSMWEPNITVVFQRVKKDINMASAHTHPRSINKDERFCPRMVRLRIWFLLAGFILDLRRWYRGWKLWKHFET